MAMGISKKGPMCNLTGAIKAHYRPLRMNATIVLTNDEIEEIWRLVPVGTIVEIEP